MNPYRTWKEKLDTAIKEFQRREISDDVFRACLHSAGFTGVRLTEEFNYQYGLRHDIEKLKTLDGKVSFPLEKSPAAQGSRLAGPSSQAPVDLQE